MSHGCEFKTVEVNGFGVHGQSFRALADTPASAGCSVHRKMGLRLWRQVRESATYSLHLHESETQFIGYGAGGKPPTSRCFYPGECLRACRSGEGAHKVIAVAGRAVSPL